MSMSCVSADKTWNVYRSADGCVGALIRSSFLVLIASEPFHVYSAHFIQNFTTPRWTWGLSWRFTVPLSLMLAASMAPAPLWAAAIAPLPAERNTTGVIDIPTFNTSNATALWNRDPSRQPFGSQGTDGWLSEQGFFTYDSQILRAALLASAREASLVANGTQRHNKLDKTGYIHIGRSYGMGSTAGFAQVAATRAPEWYQYNETGIRADVSCFYNRSIQYSFNRINRVGSPLGLWQSHGKLADGTTGGWINYAAWQDYELFAWTSVYDKPNRRIQMQLITGANSTNVSVRVYVYSTITDLVCRELVGCS
jgi:hypothetical protein